MPIKGQITQIALTYYISHHESYSCQNHARKKGKGLLIAALLLTIVGFVFWKNTNFLQL
jgi:hypothetical protein